MTGWRIGFAAGPAALIQAMANIQSQSTSNPNSIAQVAAQAAFEGDQQCVQEMNTIYEKRQRFFAQGLNDLLGVTCLPPMGAFYCFPAFPKWIGQSTPFASDYVLADYLLNKSEFSHGSFTAFFCLR